MVMYKATLNGGFEMNLKSDATDRLFDAILGLETVEDCYAFFEDLCTIKEIKDMTQRLETAKMLYDGKNYLSIAETVGLSTATISRVSRCLNYGTGGYKAALERQNETHKNTDE